MKFARLSDSQDHISAKAVADGARLVPAGAILVVVRGMILAHTLPVAHAERPLAFNQDIKAFVPNDDIDGQFVEYWLRANAAKILGLTTESTHGTKRLASDTLFAVPVTYPLDRDEQARVGDVLRDIDALIESLEQLRVKKRQIKGGAMQELLGGKRRLPGFASPWKTFALGDLFTFSGGVSASRDQLSEQGHCYLHYGDIHTSVKTFVDVPDEYSRIPKLDIQLAKVPRGALLEDGDVVFVDASEDEEGASKHVVVMNLTRVPFISGLHTIVAKPMNDAVANSFRQYCFQSPDVKAQFRFYAVGTKVLGVSKSNIKKIEIAVPPRPEQEAIAEILVDMDADITTLQQKLEKARHVKHGMMEELLTGRIRLVDVGPAEKGELAAATQRIDVRLERGLASY